MHPGEGSEDQFSFLFEIILILDFEDIFEVSTDLWHSCLYLISTLTLWEFNYSWIFFFFM